MNIYLDIDGVLLTKDGKPAIGVTEFLKEITEKHTCFWLTTHCRDDTLEHVHMYLNSRLPSEAFEYARKVRANVWDFMKTEGIDFSQDFLWFDDYLMEGEKEFLSKNGVLNSFYLIDLEKYPNQLNKKYL